MGIALLWVPRHVVLPPVRHHRLTSRSCVQRVLQHPLRHGEDHVQWVFKALLATSTTRSLKVSSSANWAIEVFCSRYEVRTRASRLKICYPSQLDQPTEQREQSWTCLSYAESQGRKTVVNRPSLGEFDRFRTCDLQIHNLTLYLLSYKLHFVAPEGVEPSLTSQNLLYCRYTIGLRFVRTVGLEPTYTNYVVNDTV